MTIDLGSRDSLPVRPAQRKTCAVLIIIVVLAAMDWTAADIRSLLLVAVAALGIVALTSI